ncbi:homocitrate synthase [Sarocladium implicatum]|nr:homocitrate synthase [Sarocladium implicatum]
MPLHLLGKKSWNVYNADNIARVRRDEAAAKAEEEAEEQRMQEVDAQRRLAILRGEVPPSLPEPEKQEEDLKSARREESRYSGSSRRQRKRHGEDDTDFELRLAREKQSEAASAVERRQTNAAPIVDHAGHIDLFGDEKQRMHAEKNDEVEQKKRKKEREYEDQYTMRFSNAAGRNAPEKPWYSTSSTEVATVSAAPPSKDVWGNDDPRRKDRQAQRAVAREKENPGGERAGVEAAEERRETQGEASEKGQVTVKVAIKV